MSAEKATWKLFDLSFRVQVRLERILRKYKLRNASFEALRALALEPTKTLKVSDLNDKLTATRADTVRLLDRLEAIKMVRRTREQETDRRIVWVTITDFGRDCFEHAQAELSKLYDPIADEFAYDTLKEIVSEMEVSA